VSTEEIGPRQRAAATKKRRTRRWILDAARPLLDEHGWYGVSLQETAKAAGVSIATQCNHFPTKRDLVVAAYEPEILPFIEHAEEVIGSQAEAEVALTNFIQELAVLLTNYPTLNRALLPVGREENPADEVHPVLHQLVELLGKLIEAHWSDKGSHGRYGRVASVSARYHLFGLLAWIAEFAPPPPVEVSAEILLRSLL